MICVLEDFRKLFHQLNNWHVVKHQYNHCMSHITAPFSFLTRIKYGLLWWWVSDVQLRVWRCSSLTEFMFCLFICLVLNRLSVPPAQHWTLEQKLQIKRRPEVQRGRNVAEGQPSIQSHPKHIIRALSCRRMTLYDSFQTELTAVVPLIDSAERDLASSELISISMHGWKKGACFSSASAKMS